MESPSRTRTILTNASAQVAATLVSRALSVPVAALLARSLSQDEYGEYNYLLSFVSIFAAFATLGLPNFFLREAVHRRERAPLLLTSAYLLEALLGVLTILTILAIGGAGRSPASISYLLLMATGMVLSVSANLFQYVFNGFNRSYLTALVQICASLLNTLLLLAAALWRPRLETLAWLYLLYGASQHLLSIAVFRSFFRDVGFARRWPALADFKEALVGALPYVLLVAFNTLYFRIDIVLLERWSTLAEVANYAAGYKFLEIVNLLVALVSGVLFAEFSNMLARGEAGLEPFLERTFRYMVMIALPVAALIAFAARDILYLFYGNAYLQSTGVLQLLAWTTVFTFAQNLLNGFVQANNRVRIQVAVYATSSLLNIGLNAWLIPRWGGAGAAVATLACEGFNVAIFAGYITRTWKIQLIDQRFLAIALAFAAMLAVFWTGGYLGWVLGPCLFIAILVRTGGLAGEDLTLVRRLIARRGR